MADDDYLEVYRQHRAAQDKFAYFLLAGAGAAIAFSIDQTKNAALEPSHLALGAAVVAWGLSFYSGCRHLTHLGAGLWANIGLLRVQKGTHPGVGTDPERKVAAEGGIRKAIDSHSEKSSKYARWQWALFLVGVALFVVWHGYQMYLRAPKVPEGPANEGMQQTRSALSTTAAALAADPRCWTDTC